MMIKDLLPIGSVVLLKEGEKRLMICGVLQQEADGSGDTYDYMGVFYPEGHIGDKYQYLFKHEDIEKLYFRGYEDDEREEFINKLAEAYGDEI